MANLVNVVRMRASRVLAASLLLATSHCAVANKINGVVIDAETKKPVPEAYVIAKWTVRGSDGLGSRTSCPFVDVVRADSMGRFQVADHLRPSDAVRVSVYAYKIGYRPGPPSGNEVLTIRPATGGEKERLDSLGGYLVFNCGYKQDRNAVNEILRPLFRAIDQETKDFAPENKTQLENGLEYLTGDKK